MAGCTVLQGVGESSAPQGLSPLPVSYRHTARCGFAYRVFQTSEVHVASVFTQTYKQMQHPSCVLKCYFHSPAVTEEAKGLMFFFALF